MAVMIPCLHAFAIQGDLERIIPLVLAAVCSWGTAYLLVTISVVLLRIRRPDLHRAYRSPFFPIPQIISSVGIIVAIVYITPPGMDKSDVYLPFAIMLGLTASYALVWTVFVQKVNPFKPVDVELVLSNTFSKEELEEVQLEPLRNLA